MQTDSIIHQCQASNCLACQTHHKDRRWFLKGSLSAMVFTMPLLWKPGIAMASRNQAKALVLSCIDFRFIEAEQNFLSLSHLEKQYDWTALAGASLAISGFPHTAEAEVFWDQLALSRQLHQIEKVIILDHQDCGAFASKIDPNLSQNPQQEQQVHIKYLSRAYHAIHQRYPELAVELYFVTLDSEFRPVSPIQL